jgi:hypothetical protein
VLLRQHRNRNSTAAPAGLFGSTEYGGPMTRASVIGIGMTPFGIREATLSGLFIEAIEADGHPTPVFDPTRKE